MSANRKRRERRTLEGRSATLLKPFLRYSSGRDAWVLKGIGDRFGPVYRIGPSRIAGRRNQADEPREDQG